MAGAECSREKEVDGCCGEGDRGSEETGNGSVGGGRRAVAVVIESVR